MRKELDDKLCKDFPLLYADRHTDMKQTCMCWGFECGDGWYDLIYDLSSKLEILIAQYIADFPDEKDFIPRAVQVKSKYGGLRFYMSPSTAAMEKVIEIAEEKSMRTCERCGAPGEQLAPNHWVFTACEEHANGY